ncbi:MAG: hypothetical protein AAGN35_20475 [Bacteroidota bacterium]
MKRSFFTSYLNVMLFLTATVLILSVAFTLITGMSPLEALNVSPLAATIGFVAVIAALIVLPFITNRLRGKDDQNSVGDDA